MQPSRPVHFASVLASLFFSVAGIGHASGQEHDLALSTFSPLGFSGAINTPVAKVLPTGSAAITLTQSIPEVANPRPGVGGFGVLTGGVGLLPGLEAFGRLSFSGDLQCNLYSAQCPGGQRDLSISAKYQWPFELPMNSRFATGFTDFGGAATNYRSVYGVLTSDFGPMDVSIGYARKSSDKALMNGVFGSAVFRLTDQLRAQLETDTQNNRAGLAYVTPVNAGMDIVWGLSRKFASPTSQQASQAGISLLLHLDGQRQRDIKKPVAPLQAASIRQPSHDRADLPGPSTTSDAKSAPAEPRPARAQLVQALQQAGFAHVRVQNVQTPNQATTEPPVVWVQAEAIAWRQNRLQALGVALRTWLQHSTEDQLLFTLTYQAQPVMTVRTSRACALQFRQGHDTCQGGPALNFLPLTTSLSTSPDSETTGDVAIFGRPQFELGLGLRSTLGTEYGLADYSAALELTAEMPVAKGWGLQATASTPLAQSQDFEPGGVFANRSYRQSRIEQALITYWTPVGAWSAQASAGYINASDRGAQADILWQSAEGDWRAHAVAGHYINTDGLFANPRRPLLGSVRYSIVPGLWHAEVTAGQFYNQDRGWSLSSSHWFGDTRFKIYLRRTGLSDDPQKPMRRFAGMELSFPLGPQQGGQLAGLSVRGRDRWSHALETKVGERDNNLTSGYGVVPNIRHGLTTDVTDHDRAGLLDLWANRDRIRLAMRETVGKNLGR